MSKPSGLEVLQVYMALSIAVLRLLMKNKVIDGKEVQRRTAEILGVTEDKLDKTIKSWIGEVE